MGTNRNPQLSPPGRARTARRHKYHTAAGRARTTPKFDLGRGYYPAAGRRREAAEAREGRVIGSSEKQTKGGNVSLHPLASRRGLPVISPNLKSTRHTAETKRTDFVRLKTQLSSKLSSVQIWANLLKFEENPKLESQKKSLPQNWGKRRRQNERREEIL